MRRMRKDGVTHESGYRNRVGSLIWPDNNVLIRKNINKQ